MSEFLKHITSGMRNAIIVDTPDFSVNNQYLDMENISKDLKISISRLDIYGQTRKSTSTKNRKLGRKK